MGTLIGVVFGVVVWFFVRYGLGGFYTIGPSERAVLTTFGRAQRLGEQTTLDDPVAATLRADERSRYAYPQVRVIMPGFYWKFPWQEVHRASVATATASIAFDPEDPSANHAGRVLEAVTKDQLNIGLTGQIRYTISERNLYAFLFGVKHPIAHIMGYFISILRDRIANFSAPGSETSGTASHALITGIDPPPEVDSALAAINTAYNHVSSEISLVQASADQKIVQSRRAVEIETLNAQAEVQPLLALANELASLKSHGEGALRAYIRNARLALFSRVDTLLLEQELEVK